MEKNRFTVMFPVSKPTGHLLDRLYLAIDPFGKGIRYAMLEVSQNIAKMSFQRLSCFDNRLEPTVCSPKIPAFEVFLCVLRIGIIPKMPQGFFDRPGPGSFQSSREN